jgi:hypothetical protein
MNPKRSSILSGALVHIDDLGDDYGVADNSKSDLEIGACCGEKFLFIGINDLLGYFEDFIFNSCIDTCDLELTFVIDLGPVEGAINVHFPDFELVHVVGDDVDHLVV